MAPCLARRALTQWLWLVTAVALTVLACIALSCFCQAPSTSPEQNPTAQNAPAESSSEQNPSPQNSPATASDKKALHVSWLYGSFVPKDVPFKPLTANQRWKLYVKMTYTTYGIYFKTAFFAISDQINNRPSGWEQTPEGFAKRFGTRQAQFIVQNTVTAFGDGVADWEVRYERCRCDGFWPRTRHAIKRNFVTYGGQEMNLRPQLMPYVGAFAAGVTAASWQPNNPNLAVKGYQAAITQVGVGIGVNWLAEFAPEIKRVLRIDKK
jgi:hypothetical protein